MMPPSLIGTPLLFVFCFAVLEAGIHDFSADSFRLTDSYSHRWKHDWTENQTKGGRAAQ
jgi:hypothetical protein